ncbi:MAG: hypothetical protein ACJASQ_003576 [Crocinitomicaceae bacterium]|jgi:hypothetical protein
MPEFKSSLFIAVLVDYGFFDLSSGIFLLSISAKLNRKQKK